VKKPKTAAYIKNICFFLCMFFSLSAAGQLNKIDGLELIDSLRRELPRKQADTDKVKLYNLLSFRYFTYYPDTGLYYGKLALNLAIKIGWKKGEARAYNSIGANYWAKNNFIKADDYYLKSLKINTALNDKKEMARNFHNIADIYEIEGDYSQALSYYKKSIDFSESIKDMFAVYGTEENVAEVYKVQKDYKNAVNYTLRAIQLAKSQGWQRCQAYSMVNFGDILSEQKKFSDALLNEKQALIIFKKIAKINPLKDDVANTYGNIGAIYYLQGDYKASAAYFKRAFSQYKIIPGIWTNQKTAECLEKAGKCYVRMALNSLHYKSQKEFNINSKEATNLLDSALKRFYKSKDWAGLQDTYLTLAQVMEKENNYPASLFAYKHYLAFKDSISVDERDKEITIKTMQYEFAGQKDSLALTNKVQQARLHSLQQEQELNKLRAKQQWIYIISAAIILCALMLIVFYYNRAKRSQLKNQLIKERADYQLNEIKHKNKLIQATLTALISQMNPHFIFNALNTIQDYIYSNDKRSAVYYLGQFSELTRKILDNSGEEMVSLDEELKMLQLYLEMEKIRFGESLNILIHIDPEIDIELVFLPPMLLQPHIENAIKHGLMHKKGEKRLTITVNNCKTAEEVSIEIDDNGIGRKESMLINKKSGYHRSFATKATQTRIELINDMFDHKIRFDILDKKSPNGTPEGTNIKLHIPLIMKNSQVLM